MKASKKTGSNLKLLPSVLSPHQLANLSLHKYASAGTTLLDPIFQPFWVWTVNKIPMNIAPNLLTIIGLIVNVVTSLLMMFYSPNADVSVPSLVLLLCGIGLFVYQTLDAIDGKQARRTNSSTPLGELFDHGCDAISTIFVGLASCIGLMYGRSDPWLVFTLCMVGMSTFYVAHWRTYVTGKLTFGKVDVTEGQVSLYTIFLLTAIFGDSIWTITLPILNLELRYIPCILATAAPIFSVLSNFYAISQGGIGKNRSTVANTSILSPLFPLLVVVLLSIMIAIKSADNLFENNISLYLLSFGFVWAKTTIRLIVAHMTKGELVLFDWCLVGPAMLLFNQYFNFFLPEYLVLWICLLVSLYDVLQYSSKVCLEICDHLNIYLFKIDTPQRKSSYNK